MSNSESGYVEFPGTKIYYEVEGGGPDLTLIHAGVAHLRMWDEQVAAWRDRFRIIRYDTRGWGRTLTEDVPYSNADDLLHVLDHVGSKRTHLIGASRGGSIALDFTLEHPDRVSSLTLVAAGLGGFEADDPRLAEAGKEEERLWEARDWEGLVELETQVWTDGLGQPRDRVDPDVRRRMVQWNLESYRAEQEADQVRRLDPPAVGRLAEVKVPTLVMWGTLDTLDTIAAGERMASAIHGARRQVFEGVAHMVNLERPAEFNELVPDFVLQAEAKGAAQNR